jgi:gas vesicle protein
MADESNNGFGIGWFLAGLGLGALLGVLYAPKSGRETREDLVSTAIDAKNKAADLIDKGRRQAEEYVDRGKEYYDKGRSQWSEYVDRGRGYLDDQRERVAAAVEAGKQAYQASSEPHNS